MNQAIDDYAADEIAAREEFEMPQPPIRIVAKSRVDPAKRPVPVGYRILIEMLPIEEMTKSGLILSAQTVEAKEHVRAVGQVVAMGPLAYRHNKFMDPNVAPGFGRPEPWCKVGDWVLFNAYAGDSRDVENSDGRGFTTFKIINDDEVMATVPDPTAVRTYV